MANWTPTVRITRFKPNARFAEFVELFAGVGSHEKLFPKDCHACGQQFRSLRDFLRRTTPVRHALEDCTHVLHSPATMLYQNCRCGTTLIITFTDETYPCLDRLWETLRDESEVKGRPLQEVVTEFRDQCYYQIVEAYDAAVMVTEGTLAEPARSRISSPRENRGWLAKLRDGIAALLDKTPPAKPDELDLSPRERRAKGRHEEDNKS